MTTRTRTTRTRLGQAARSVQGDIVAARELVDQAVRRLARADLTTLQQDVVDSAGALTSLRESLTELRADLLNRVNRLYEVEDALDRHALRR